MYEYIKKMVQEKPLFRVGLCLVFITIIAFILFCTGRSSDSDYQRASGTVERIEEQQHKSTELNQSSQNAIERSTDLNNQASERIKRIEEYQQSTSERIKTSTKQLDEATGLLERNERIFDEVESGYKAEQGNRKTP